MERQIVAEVVSRLYMAAGRRVSEGDLVLYAEALANADPDAAREAARRMVHREDWERRPPSPALLRQYLGAVEAEVRARRPAIPPATGGRADAAVVRRELARARALLAASRVRRPREEERSGAA